MGCGTYGKIEGAVKGVLKSGEKILTGKADSGDWINVGTAGVGSAVGAATGAAAGGAAGAGAAAGAGLAVDQLPSGEIPALDAISDLKVDNVATRLRRNLFATSGKMSGENVGRVGGRNAIFRN